MNDAEKTWLEENKNLCLRCEWNYYDNPCIRYGRLGESGSCPGFEPRGHKYDYQDAAEFEARVAAELAIARMEINWGEDISCCLPTMTHRECLSSSVDCHWCCLKYARLAVEAEMETEHDRS